MKKKSATSSKKKVPQKTAKKSHSSKKAPLKVPMTKKASPKKTPPKRPTKNNEASQATAPAHSSVASTASAVVSGSGTREKPWLLKTPPGTSDYQAYREESSDPPALVVQVGKTELRYRLDCLADLVEMLKKHGDWMPLGAADEQKPAADGTVEAWGRSPTNPVGGWYGLKKGLRGRFAMYVPPVLEALGLVELEHLPKNNRVRAK